MDINTALEKIYSLKQFNIKLGLDNIKKFLIYLGNPQQNLKIFHIAGSNGKGSTSSFIASILMECDFKVGLFTSPHFVRFNERIKINGIEISDDYITTFLEKHKKYIDIEKPTFFEVATALAYTYFSENNINYAVIETGLGGRLDATNTALPIASIITSISLEHTNILGNSIEKIALEKAGIIKTGVPVFAGKLSLDAYNTIKIETQKKNSNFFNLIDFLEDFSDYVKLNLNKDVYNIYSTQLRGRHQLYNAALAVFAVNKTLNINDYKIFNRGIDNIIINTSIKGRYEVYSESPTIIFDSAHNLEGVQSFVNEFCKEYNKFENTYLIYGAMKDKSNEDMLLLLRKYFQKIYVTSINNERAASIEELRYIAEKINLKVNELINPFDFIINFKRQKKNNCLVVLGSMYLLGEIKSKLEFNN